MNERIEEIAKQACFDEIGKDYSLYFNLTKDKVENFAKLIVQECASICYNSGLGDSDAHAQNLLYEFNIDSCRSDK